MTQSLSSPAPRKVIHTRRIQCQGFRREDGLWDIEAQLIDTKTYPFPKRELGTWLPPGEAVHEMEIRATVDDSMTIQKIEARTVNSPFGLCVEVADGLACLEGVSLGAGFMRVVQERLGHNRGCVHLVGMLAQLAATAHQTIPTLLRLERPPSVETPWFIDTCKVMAADSPVVRQIWPQYTASGTHRDDD